MQVFKIHTPHADEYAWALIRVREDVVVSVETSAPDSDMEKLVGRSWPGECWLFCVSRYKRLSTKANDNVYPEIEEQ